MNTAHVDTHRFLRQCKMEDARILNENTVFCDADDVKRAASNQSIMTQAIAWLKTHNADLTHHAMPSMLDLPSYQRILADQYAYAKDRGVSIQLRWHDLKPTTLQDEQYDNTQLVMTTLYRAFRVLCQLIMRMVMPIAQILSHFVRLYLRNSRHRMPMQ